MNCAYCGAQLWEDSSFCAQCGKPVEKKIYCDSCRTELDARQLFCHKCGLRRRMDGGAQPAKRAGTASAKKVASPTPAAAVNLSAGTLLRKVNRVTRFRGEPTASINHVVGTLCVYDNRLEFSCSAGLKFLAGIAEFQTDVIPFQNITRIRTGAYLGIYTTLVADLTNGQTFSFAPAVPGSSEMKNVMDLIMAHIRK